MLTQNEVKRVFNYHPDTGKLTWKISVGVKIWAGKTAGHLRENRIRVRYKAKNYYAHRLIWLYVHGEWPAGVVDHIDHDTLNNKISNLRVVDTAASCRNKSIQYNNKTGISGVRKTYSATIGVASKTIHLGNFKSFFEACCARKSAEQKYGFHQKHGQDEEV